MSSNNIYKWAIYTMAMLVTTRGYIYIHMDNHHFPTQDGCFLVAIPYFQVQSQKRPRDPISRYRTKG
jgi:hypothetical protein